MQQCTKNKMGVECGRTSSTSRKVLQWKMFSSSCLGGQDSLKRVFWYEFKIKIPSSDFFGRLKREFISLRGQIRGKKAHFSSGLKMHILKMNEMIEKIQSRSIIYFSIYIEKHWWIKTEKKLFFIGKNILHGYLSRILNRHSLQNMSFL